VPPTSTSVCLSDFVLLVNVSWTINMTFFLVKTNCVEHPSPFWHCFYGTVCLDVRRLLRICWGLLYVGSK
jgi:hypothetical protein